MNEIEREQRQRVVEEAKTWLETPYHHLARLKGAGIDCAQLPIAVYSSTGMIPDFRPENYSPQWFLHQYQESYLEQVERFAKCYGTFLNYQGVTIKPEPGDFMVYRFGRTYAHGAIIIDWPTIIHAWRLGGKVCYGDASRGDLSTRRLKLYSIWREQWAD